MALVSSPYSHSSSSSYMTPQTQSHPQSPAQQDDLEDDLLAMLGSDTFSLESHRDKDLLLLSSILQNALPNKPNWHGNSHGQWIGGQPAPAAMSWNGWKPDSGIGSYAGPSTSAASTSSMALPSPQQPPSTPLPTTTTTSPAESRRFPSRSNSNSNSNSWGVGVRAPAASREREIQGRSRQSSLAMDMGRPAAEDEEMEMDEEMDDGDETETAGSSGFSNFAPSTTGLAWTSMNSSGAGTTDGQERGGGMQTRSGVRFSR